MRSFVPSSLSLLLLLSFTVLGCSGAQDSTSSGGASSSTSSSGGDPSSPSPAPSSPANPSPPPAVVASTYFPPAGDAATWETIDPTSAKLDAAKLDAVTTFVGDSASTSFIVLYDGRIVTENYWSGATATTLRDIASAQKTIVSLLVGVATSKGLFTLDDKVTSILGDGWSNDTPANEGSITVRHLLTMTSGLTEQLMKTAEPGAAWSYNTDAFHRLELVLETKTGQSLQDLTRANLFDAIGIGSSKWEKRPIMKDSKGVPISALMMNARDMARVGLTVMANGQWQSSQPTQPTTTQVVVPSDYLVKALSPSQTLNPSYGLLVWLNGQSNGILPGGQTFEGSMIPSAPTDVVAALGAADQKIYVARKDKLVVIRQGSKAATAQSQALSPWDEELWKRIALAKLP